MYVCTNLLVCMNVCMCAVDYGFFRTQAQSFSAALTAGDMSPKELPGNVPEGV